MTARITYFRARCIGCHSCAEVAPGQWKMSRKDGKATLIGAKEKKGVFSLLIQEMEKAVNIQAATNCPVRIIRVD